MDLKHIEINNEFKKAYDLAENSTESLLVAGRAGTGKSTFLEYFRSKTKKKIVVLAPTGVAAVNVGGQTIHSFFGFKPDITPEQAIRNANNAKKKKREKLYQSIDTIVIDEVSMVRADLMDCIDTFLRTIRAKRSMAFGGVQLLLVGDLYQLPPVVTWHEKELFSDHYKSPYFFDSHVFADVSLEYIELEKVYRQSDSNFIHMLNAVRNNSITKDVISAFNSRFDPNFEPHGQYIYLTAVNRRAFEINVEKLSQLPSRGRTFYGDVVGDFDTKALPTEVGLKLKKGAQVMLLNNDRLGRWVNGTIGTISSLEQDGVSVKFPDGSIEEIEPFTWEMYRYQYDNKKKVVATESVGSFMQYPLKLAWAITIHKSQGKTFDHVVIDVGKGTFATGQMYVALSRCRTLEGIVLKRELQKSHIWVDWRVVKFVTEHQYNISERELPIEEKLKVLLKCIDEKKRVEIVYLKSKDEKSKRLIEPIKVGKMFYLEKPFIGISAYCHNRKEQRTFRVDRILEMKVVGG
ncbi:MAG: AAA family ATPase [Pseudomonadota bacterium]